MCNLAIEMITGFGYLLIPGFLVLSLLFFHNCNMGRPEKVKADLYRLPRERKY
ncbi:hypothetical protein ACFLZ5_04105 [Thermodesulfobacteriota bacterium]